MIKGGRLPETEIKRICVKSVISGRKSGRGPLRNLSGQVLSRGSCRGGGEGGGA